MAEVQELFGVPVFSIVTLDHLVGCLDDFVIDDALRAAVRTYRACYGV